MNCLLDQNVTPLHTVVESGHLFLAKLLLDNGASLNFQNSNGWTPIITAAFYRKAELVTLFLEYNCDLNIKDNENKTALDWAKLKDFQIIIQFISQKCNNSSPLHSAAENGDLYVMKKLLEDGADINCTDPRKWTPLHYASVNGHLDIVRSLIQHGADINCLSDYNETPLHLAIENKKLGVVRLLLERGAEVSFQNFNKQTPINIATEYGKIENDEESWAKFREDQTMNQLISQKIMAFTPLHEASSKNGDFSEVLRLLDQGANVNCEDPRRWTPLHFASRDGQIEIAKLLIQKGANVNHQSDQEVTPLHLAIGKVAELLLQSGANVNIQSSSGWTALHFAVYYRKLKCVEVLLENNCDLFVKNKDGKTAEDLALALRNQEIANLILQKKMELLPVTQNSTSTNLVRSHGDCKVCFGPKNEIFAFQPCGHAVACKQCCETILGTPDSKCPFCRNEVNWFQKIFM